MVTVCLIALINSMPAGYFNERDLSLLEDAVVSVLEDESAVTTRTWNNEENGHSGKVTSFRAFKNAEGKPCKKVQIDNAAEGYRSSMRYDICLHPDGNWREIDSGLPFGKARNPKGAP